jgi:hypothetical protein
MFILGLGCCHCSSLVPFAYALHPSRDPATETGGPGLFARRVDGKVGGFVLKLQESCGPFKRQTNLVNSSVVLVPCYIHKMPLPLNKMERKDRILVQTNPTY